MLVLLYDSIKYKRSHFKRLEVHNIHLDDHTRVMLTTFINFFQWKIVVFRLIDFKFIVSKQFLLKGCTLFCSMSRKLRSKNVCRLSILFRDEPKVMELGCFTASSSASNVAFLSVYSKEDKKQAQFG